MANPVSQKIDQLSEHLDNLEGKLGTKLGDGTALADKFEMVTRLAAGVHSVAMAMHHLQMLKSAGGHE